MDDNMARAHGRNLSISTKQSVEICNNIRNMSVQKAKTLLENVIDMKQPIRMTRYMKDTAHKKEIGAGKYPVKAAKEILALLKSAESNAQNKGLSTKDLVIKHMSAHLASRPFHYGRKRRVKMKRTHVQIVLLEKKKTSKDNTDKKSVEKKTIVEETKK